MDIFIEDGFHLVEHYFGIVLFIYGKKLEKNLEQLRSNRIVIIIFETEYL